MPTNYAVNLFLCAKYRWVTLPNSALHFKIITWDQHKTSLVVASKRQGAHIILVVDNNVGNDGVNERGIGMLPADAMAAAVNSKFAI